MAFGYKDTDANWSDILTTTFAKVTPQFIDQVFQARPLAYFLARAGQVIQIDGGARIQEALIAQDNSANTITYSGVGAIDNTPQEEVTSAIYDWKQLASTVSISGIEEAQNSGEAAFLDLLNTKIEVARESVVQKMNEMFYAAGGVSGTDPNDFHGIGLLVKDTTSVVGGINPANNTWWKSQVHDATDANAFDHTIETELDRTMMTNVFNDASVGGDTPQFIITTQALHEKYEGLLQGNVRYMDTALADAGFQSLEFKGRPVLFDDDCPTGEMYFINPKYLRLKVHRDRFFKAGPFIQPVDKDTRTMKMLTYGNLTINSRRHQGCITGLTTS
ncbi:MAG: phage major capsid protein [Gammaproteobacteria bacterium]